MNVVYIMNTYSNMLTEEQPPCNAVILSKTMTLTFQRYHIHSYPVSMTFCNLDLPDPRIVVRVISSSALPGPCCRPLMPFLSESERFCHFQVRLISSFWTLLELHFSKEFGRGALHRHAQCAREQEISTIRAALWRRFQKLVKYRGTPSEL